MALGSWVVNARVATTGSNITLSGVPANIDGGKRVPRFPPVAVAVLLDVSGRRAPSWPGSAFAGFFSGSRVIDRP